VVTDTTTRRSKGNGFPHLPPPTKNPSTTAAAPESNEMTKTLRVGSSRIRRETEARARRGAGPPWPWRSTDPNPWRGGSQPGESDLGRRVRGARWSRGGRRRPSPCYWRLLDRGGEAGGERGTRSGEGGTGGEVVICAWLFGRLAGVDERLGWLAHSLVLAAARDETTGAHGASSSQFLFSSAKIG
jgi:hypothetical protein